MKGVEKLWQGGLKAIDSFQNAHSWFGSNDNEGPEDKKHKKDPDEMYEKKELTEYKMNLPQRAEVHARKVLNDPKYLYHYLLGKNDFFFQSENFQRKFMIELPRLLWKTEKLDDLGDFIMLFPNPSETDNPGGITYEDAEQIFEDIFDTQYTYPYKKKFKEALKEAYLRAFLKLNIKEKITTKAPTADGPLNSELSPRKDDPKSPSSPGTNDPLVKNPSKINSLGNGSPKAADSKGNKNEGKKGKKGKDKDGKEKGGKANDSKIQSQRTKRAS